MNFEEFSNSLASPFPPHKLSQALKALWYDAKGDWDTAHDMAQEDSGNEAAWVHAYLHRKEGDLSNANYWYQRAGQTMSSHSLKEEWVIVARTLLEKCN
ncbi:hypothetical protein AAG747_24110 [Rapidithrix thailandica]|uniref:Uncharacterized protein n=1 Tax=Rapidithrix thailandica TaxID=413964 RepID=A0AAW9S4D6_9BACT